MTECPLVSVIMPIFNRDSYLDASIGSVLAQTYENWELLLVDDGSKDQSGEIAQRYVDLHPEKIRLLHHPHRQNLGISASRNLGHREARGTLLAFLDSDDLWVPNRLQSHMDLLKQFPQAGLLVGSTKMWHPDEPERDYVVHVGAPERCLLEPPSLFSILYPVGTGCAPSMNTVLVRSELVRQAGGWEDRFRTAYEDQALFCKLYLIAPVVVSREILDYYRQHPSSVMAVELSGRQYMRQRRVFLEWLLTWFQAHAADKVVQLQLVQSALMHPALWREERPFQYAIWRVGKYLRQLHPRARAAAI